MFPYKLNGCEFESLPSHAFYYSDTRDKLLVSKMRRKFLRSYRIIRNKHNKNIELFNKKS